MLCANSLVAGISYQLAPRAKISRRDQGLVSDLAQLKAYMRSNSWSTDPYSGNSSFGAICGRGDINLKHPMTSGCDDAKVRQRTLMDAAGLSGALYRCRALLYGSHCSHCWVAPRHGVLLQIRAHSLRESLLRTETVWDVHVHMTAYLLPIHSSGPCRIYMGPQDPNNRVMGCTVCRAAWFLLNMYLVLCCR